MKKDKNVENKLLFDIVKDENELTSDDLIDEEDENIDSKSDYESDLIHYNDVFTTVTFYKNVSSNNIEDEFFNDVKSFDDRIYQLIMNIQPQISLSDRDNTNTYGDYFIRMFRYFLYIGFKKECIKIYNRKNFLVALFINLCEYDGIDYKFMYDKLPEKIKHIIKQELSDYLGKEKFDKILTHNPEFIKKLKFFGHNVDTINEKLI